MSSVRLVRRDERDAAAKTLAAAFTPDVWLRWMVSDDRRRPAVTHRWMRTAVEAGFRGGHCWVVEDMSAVACWAAPTQSTYSADMWARQSTLIVGSEGDRAQEVFEFLNQVGDCHPEEPHWYLSLLGAAEPGRGAGVRVVEPVLRHCDAVGELAYLESSNPRNISFYERLGFEAITELRPEGGPVFTPMRREPR